MFIRVDDETATVEEADDFGRLHVITALDGDRLDRTLRLTGIGRIAEDGSVALDIQALHDRAAKAGSIDDWESRWTQMIDYATGKGWVSADRRQVHAHIEPPQ